MKQFSKLKLQFISLLCISSLLTKAQQCDTLEIQRNEKEKISFARFKPDANTILGISGLFNKITPKTLIMKLKLLKTILLIVVCYS